MTEGKSAASIMNKFMDVTFKRGMLPVPLLNPDNSAMDEHCLSTCSELEGFTSSTEIPMLINNTFSKF